MNDNKNEIEVFPGKTITDTSPTPNFSYHGGLLLNTIEIYTIFWGSQWHNKQHQQVAEKVQLFLETFIKSSIIQELSEYNVENYVFEPGQYRGSAICTFSDPPATVTDTLFREYFDQIVLNSRTYPQKNVLYMIYLPSGIDLQKQHAYHDAINKEIFYAIIPYPKTETNKEISTIIDSITSASSRILIGAITDPVPGQGWYDQNYGEISDICGVETKSLESFNVLKHWSNNEKKCI